MNINKKTNRAMRTDVDVTLSKSKVTTMPLHDGEKKEVN